MNVVAEPSYTEGGALLLDGNRLRDLTVGHLKDRIEQRLALNLSCDSTRW